MQLFFLKFSTSVYALNCEYRKRKADASPIKNDRIKRCALTNLTNNNVIKNDNDENCMKKENVLANKDFNVQPNIQPISYRTRAAVAASNVQSDIKAQIKAPKKIKAFQGVENVVKEKEPKNNKVAAVTQNAITVLKSKALNVDTSTKSISTRRISNEFEKTEESLYVSALEDISSDVSRLSDKTKVSSNISSDRLSVTTVTLSQASNFSTATDTSEDTDIFQDAISRKLPQGVVHFDKENWNDTFQVSHYAMDIFEYLKHQEHKFQIKDYMSSQPELSKWMRSLLVDWMVEVQESFELNHETLYLAIKIVDTYLGNERVSKDSLQLLGAAALLIACKYDVSLERVLFIFFNAFNTSQ